MNLEFQKLKEGERTKFQTDCYAMVCYGMLLSAFLQVPTRPHLRWLTARLHGVLVGWIT